MSKKSTKTSPVEEAGSSSNPSQASELTEVFKLMMQQHQQQLTQQQEQFQAMLTQVVQQMAPAQPSSAPPLQQPALTSHTPPVKTLPIPKLSAPDTLTIPEFRDWKQRWEDYFRALQLDLQPVTTQHGLFRSALDQEWTILWNSGRLQVSNTSTLDGIISAMEKFLRQRRSPLLDRREFIQRNQMPGESVDRYYAALRSLDDAGFYNAEPKCAPCRALIIECKLCNGVNSLAKDAQEERIRDRLISGLLDKDMQEKVLMEPFDETLTLDKVLKICVAVETSKATGARLNNSQPEAAQASRNKSTYKKQQQQSERDPNHCWNCGKDKHPDRSQCPAKDAECENCGRIGHYKKVCRSKPKWGNKHQNSNSSGSTQSSTPATSQDPPRRSNSNRACNATTQRLLTISTTIGNRTYPVKWLPDTGAEVDAISLQALEQIGIPESTILPEKQDVVAANGESLGPVGSVLVTLQLNGRAYSTFLRVFRHVTTPLLSLSGCRALGLVDTDWPFSQLYSSASNRNITYGTRSFTQSTQQVASADLKYFVESLQSDFPEVFNDTTLRAMDGPEMEIKLMEGAIPVKRYVANTVPYHWRDAVKSQLDAMESKGIVERVPLNEPADWCHPMVTVPKKGSAEPRITVDLTGLNKYVRRPAYPVKVPKEVVARIPPGNKYFTTLDARHGYWQVPLSEPSRRLTTFITPWGLYRFRRNVMGLISAGDEHNRRGDEAFEGIPNLEKIVEDILLYDTDLSTHLKRVRNVIERCQEHGITLNVKKLVIAKPEVDWCGFRISSSGYTPAPHLVQALTNFPVPANKTDIRSFLGLVQQFESFSHRLSELALPIRSLLSNKSAFIWEGLHQQAFQSIIQELSSPRVLTHFHPSRPLRLETDAAQSKGLGYALYQQEPNSTWKLLQTGSRFVTPTESRYSATEVEMLAVVWAVKKCRLFLLGRSFELIVDHRPLIPIINSKTLDEVENPRLQRFKEKLTSFLPFAIWRAGTKHTVVDVFSRFPCSDPEEDDLNEDLDSDPAPLRVAALQDASDGSRIIPDALLDSIREMAASDSVYTRLKELITNGFPDKSQLDEDLHPYWKVRDDLATENGLIYKGCQLLVPLLLRPSILKALHASHQGQERTLRRARQSVFWPNLNNDVRNTVRTCPECSAHLPSQQREPLLPYEPPDYPFQVVAVDLFSYAGYEYLLMVDQFSGWINVAKCGHSATTSTIIYHLKQWMISNGIPQKLISDNGPQFSSLEFSNWSRKWVIHHDTSSPHYPQSNGLAEVGVRTIKHLLAKTSLHGDITSESFQLGLLELRNTPRADGRSPAQILFGTPLRSNLPLHRSRFAVTWKTRSAEMDSQAPNIKEKAHMQYDASAKPLSNLNRGDIVWVQDHRTRKWTTLAEIIEIHIRGRSYTLKTESGRILRRNRRFLRPHTTARTPTATPSPETEVPLRRSTRNRKAPSRFAHNVQVKLDPGSRFWRGVDGDCSASHRPKVDPQEPKEQREKKHK